MKVTSVVRIRSGMLGFFIIIPEDVQMIQEIAPHSWDNIYHNRKPKEDSIVLFFCMDELLVMEPAGGEEGASISFPAYSYVEEYACDCTYLFSLDSVSYFRVHIDNKWEMEKLCEDLINRMDGRPQLRPRKFFRTAKPKELAFAAITGMHINGWYLKNKYCGACGGRLVHDERERMLFCPKCRNMVYPRINPAVIVAVTDKNRLLLTKYRGREYTNYALIAGFNEVGESMEETVRREVMEEAGIRVKNIRYYKSQPWAFADNILMGYYCEADGDTTIKMDEDELSVAEWMDREQIPVRPEDLSLTNEMICRFCIDK